MKYTEICEAKTAEEMRAKFDKLMSDLLRTHPDVDPEQLRSTQLSNLGYMAGYYNFEVFQNIMQWLGTSHPIFGRNYPTPEEAFKKGKTTSKG